MAASQFSFPALHFGVIGFILVFFNLCSLCRADNTTQLIAAQDADGNAIWLRDDRKPALYTSTFGDCQGDSLINVTRFDAAYYHDNMTVLFHLEGNTAVKNESLMSEQT